MPEEMGLFVTTFQLHDEGTISWDELVEGMGEIRTMLGGVADNAAEHTSNLELRGDRFKHVRYKKDPMDKYKAPMTESQKLGWHEEEVYNERFPKNSCNETRYADAMVRAGVDFI